jgi:hypothetical protein
MIQTQNQKLNYKENQRLMYKNKKNFPTLKRETNSKLHSQASKLGLVKGFGEDICELVVGVNMNKVNVPFLIVVSQEVKTDLYVLGFGVENGIFGYTYGTGAITE